MTTLHPSPLSWTGSKTRLAPAIVEAFPSPDTYDVYVEPFCGSCAVLFCKPASHHLEAVNDTNRRLVLFWMTLRDQARRLTWELDTLPYSQALFQEYRQSLDASCADTHVLEEVVRWYYVQRSTFAGHTDSGKGWKYRTPHGKIVHGTPSEAISYHNAVGLLTALTDRLRGVQIHCTDFEPFLARYMTSQRVLVYADPPYVGTEQYYTADGTVGFTRADHQRLARLLNATQARVALSYYETPELEGWYPPERWRRITWSRVKESSRMNQQVQVGREVLLCNYEASAPTLWGGQESEQTP